MKIICIGRNYVAHAKELNNAVPEAPVVFMKPPSALLVNDKPFYYPDFSEDIHYECELVLRIGRNGRHVQPEFAWNYIDQVGLGIDFTARDLQQQLKDKGHPWEIAKGFDGSAVISPLIDAEEVALEKGVSFSLQKNGTTVQEGNSADMLFSIPQILVHLSKFFKLQQGDLIYTGTPAGVGPIAIGDVLEGTLETKSGPRSMFRCEIK
jgi:acylpyruvate hydrolase